MNLQVGKRIHRLFVPALIVALVFSAGSAFIAFGSENGVIYYACVNNNGNIRMVGPEEECRNNETKISWNQEGPQGVPGAPGQPGDPGDKGDPGLTWRGDWQASTEYSEGDAVAYEGSSYVALEANTNIQPDDADEWALLAKQGHKGDKGDTGLQGPPGPSGVSRAYTSTSSFKELKLAGPSDTEHHETIAQLSLPGGRYVINLTTQLSNGAFFIGQDNSREVRCYRVGGISTIGYSTPLGGLATYDQRSSFSMHDVVSIPAGGGTVEVKCYANALSFVGDDSRARATNTIISAIQVDQVTTQ